MQQTGDADWIKLYITMTLQEGHMVVSPPAEHADFIRLPQDCLSPQQGQHKSQLSLCGPCKMHLVAFQPLCILTSTPCSRELSPQYQCRVGAHRLLLYDLHLQPKRLLLRYRTRQQRVVHYPAVPCQVLAGVCAGIHFHRKHSACQHTQAPQNLQLVICLATCSCA